MTDTLKKYTIRLLIILVLYFVAMDINLFWLFGYSPGVADVKKPPVSIASELFTADGKLIGRYYKENRIPVNFDEISPTLIKALVATEDVRFYDHMGVDSWALLSSFWSTATGDNRGGSTITQQLVKNLYKTRGKDGRGLLHYIPGIRTIVFKTKEWINALKIESMYSKDEILAMYLNTVGFGNNTYGIKVACKKYFNKDPKQINTQEAALLIGMLKATSTYNPITRPEKAIQRRNVVLSQMKKYAIINDEAYQKLIKTSIQLNLSSRELDNEKDSYLRNAVSNWLKDWCEENNYDIYADGLRIYSTIDSRLQAHAEKAMKEHMWTLQRRFYEHWGREQPWRQEDNAIIPDFIETISKRTPQYQNLRNKYKSSADSVSFYMNKKKRMRIFTWKGERDTTFSSIDSIKYYVSLLQTGMMTLDPFTGYIKVWIGGIDPEYFKFDHVKQSKRQPGSTFKPFAYLAALDNGYSPCDQFIDKPVTIKYEENGEQKTWTPHNSDWVFTGNNMSLRWAMGKSCNSVTAQLTEEIGWDKVVKYAQKLGISSPLESVPSICLGSSDVSLFEMVRAYGTFLNKGIKTEPILISKITDRDGNILAEFKAEQTRVISEEIAFLMLYMFKGGIQEPGGTSQALWEYDLFRNKNELGGKTGTSSNHADGWYMGFSKDLITGVWVGADERSIHFRTSALGEGSKTALPIFGKFMEKVYKDPACGITQGPFPKPGVLISRKYICPSVVIKKDTLAIDSSFINPNLVTDSI